MVVARFSKWVFKEGKRNQVFHELDSTFGDVARKTTGYRGVISLINKDDPNVGLVITLWNDEEALKVSETAVFKSAVQKVMANLKEPPKFEKYTVFTVELKQLIPQ